MRTRTAALSPCIAASATSDLPAAPARTMASVATRANVITPALSPKPLALLDRSKFPLAISDRVLADAELVEDRQQQAAGRYRLRRIRDVAVALHASVQPSDEHVRDVVVHVLVRVAHVAAVEHERMIEQRAVAVLCLRETIDQVRQHLHVVLVDLRQQP